MTTNAGDAFCLSGAKRTSVSQAHSASAGDVFIGKVMTANGDIGRSPDFMIRLISFFVLPWIHGELGGQTLEISADRFEVRFHAGADRLNGALGDFNPGRERGIFYNFNFQANVCDVHPAIFFAQSNRDGKKQNVPLFVKIRPSSRASLASSNCRFKQHRVMRVDFCWQRRARFSPHRKGLDDLVPNPAECGLKRRVTGQIALEKVRSVLEQSRRPEC